MTTINKTLLVAVLVGVALGASAGGALFAAKPATAYTYTSAKLYKYNVNATAAGFLTASANYGSWQCTGNYCGLPIYWLQNRIEVSAGTGFEFSCWTQQIPDMWLPFDTRTGSRVMNAATTPWNNYEPTWGIKDSLYGDQEMRVSVGKGTQCGISGWASGAYLEPAIYRLGTTGYMSSSGW